jgi:hypothetical protein
MKVGYRSMFAGIVGFILGVSGSVALGLVGGDSAAERLVAHYPLDLMNTMSHKHMQTDVRADQAVPSLQVEAIPDPMKKRNFTLHLNVENFAFAPQAVSGPAKFGEGHAHVYVDDVLLGRAYGAWYHLPQLKPGQHTVYVTLNHNDHSEYAIAGKTIGAELRIDAK